MLKKQSGFIRRVLFVNNGWRELKETPSSNWKIRAEQSCSA
ncbi:hypothetical protein T12_3088 [Trichinella patagoniensis]|uniref:Uncharacterized protein n=1 Tax=Trichinella patagoniensis TaxID=990121 RepID=A0A0V0Z1G9_9BILA|nr:hypothetical protein T12_3088 [Trichinella patagoniensis]